MDIPINTIIAVVDGENFKAYRNTASNFDVKLQELPPLESQDRPSDSGRSSSAGNPQEKQMEEDAFGKGVAEKLNRMVLEGRVEKLIIIAAPRSLGEMRRNYHSKLQEVLIGEVDKTLTNLSLSDLEDALRQA